ncbi:MAG: hypothetical protein FWE41_00170 [Coriobacteriia bacterium]|nr:hypothetical protein [Coriobacteriia bacterium]MCL2750794.1 hypothetical protein [Coriobacteriia bacterium]
MFENDYIMRMIMQLTRALRKSLFREYSNPDIEIRDIEGRVAEALDLDPRLMFKLEPDSLVSLLQLGSVDPVLAVFAVRSIYYESDLLEANGELEKADLRRRQADAIAEAYNIEVTLADGSAEAMEEFLNEQELEDEYWLETEDEENEK